MTVAGTHSWMLADPDEFGEVMTNVLAIVDQADPGGSVADAV